MALLLIALGPYVAQAAGAHASERWQAEVSAFAQKIAAATGPGTATLELRNLSSLPPEQAGEIRRSLELRLRGEGISIRQEHEASAGIRVTLSENRRGWLWVAEVQQGTETRVTMLELPERPAAAAAASASPMTLRSTLLLSASQGLLEQAIKDDDLPLLDAQPLRAPPDMLAALTTRSVVLYQQQGGRWQPVRELPIPLEVTGRDPRGRIVPAADHPFDLYLPGVNCGAAVDASQAVGLTCIASDDPWPLEQQRAFYNSARNYFTGVLLPGPGRAVPPFYSAASIPSPSSTLWIFAGVDGRAASFDGTNERQLGGAAHAWGSDLAALHTDCGSGTQLLATQSGTDAASDSIQAFEIADREPIAASAPLKFNGTITALWSNTAADAATAIVHTAQGGYDAYSVALACNR